MHADPRRSTVSVRLVRAATSLFLAAAVAGCGEPTARPRGRAPSSPDAGVSAVDAQVAPGVDAARTPWDAGLELGVDAAMPMDRPDAFAAIPVDAFVLAPDAFRPAPPPLGELTCRTLAAGRTSTDASWGAVLTDIVQHLPRSYGDTYFDADTVTSGHETSHGIHSHIRNTMNDTGTRANGFYVLDGRACLVREPDMRKSDVAAYIPPALRWSRYGLYITGSSDWDDTPLYVWDEWVAYTNGSAVGVDRSEAGLWRSGWRGTVDGTIEFTVYAMAVGMAAEAREPGYFEREPNFLAFLVWNARRAMRLFRAGRVIPDFAWDEQDDYFERWRTGAEAEEMRSWMRRTLGDAVVDELLAPL
jgi:hypothetical protein